MCAMALIPLDAWEPVEAANLPTVLMAVDTWDAVAEIVLKSAFPATTADDCAPVADIVFRVWLARVLICDAVADAAWVVARTTDDTCAPVDRADFPIPLSIRDAWFAVAVTDRKNAFPAVKVDAWAPVD